MRFLANENIPAAVVIALREGGHDVVSVKESMRGADDRVVLARAQTEQRVVLTCDTDFGELAFRSRLPAECGVVLIRLEWSNPDSDNEIIVRVDFQESHSLRQPSPNRSLRSLATAGRPAKSKSDVRRLSRRSGVAA